MSKAIIIPPKRFLPSSQNALENCRWDAVALGEVLLRLDPGDNRIRASRTFSACEGGGEYNVMRGLRKTFGLSTAILTSMVDNEIGRLLEDLILQGGVDCSQIRWEPFDGIGKSARNALYFAERGFGLRPPVAAVDRARSAASQIKPDQFDWNKIFVECGTRWFHSGGVFAGLSETTAQALIQALKSASTHAVPTSYDLNFRASLYQSRGGASAAIEVNRSIVPLVQLVVGNASHFTSVLGVKTKAKINQRAHLDAENFKILVNDILTEFPNLKAVAVTSHFEQNASSHSWSACLYHDGSYVSSATYDAVPVLDRVGAGDGFLAGVLYALLNAENLEKAVNLGVAHGILAMSSAGDNVVASLQEVARIAQGQALKEVR